MSIVYLLLPASMILAVVAICGYLWASRSGQFDDLDTHPLRILNDESREDDNDGR